MLTVEQIKDEPSYPACGAGVLYECVACGQSNYPTPTKFTKKEWVGLTDEEIDRAYASCKYGTVRELARAVEAKLKEKNV